MKEEKIIIQISKVLNWGFHWAVIVGQILGYLMLNEPEKVRRFVTAHVGSCLALLEKIKETDKKMYKVVRDYVFKEIERMDKEGQK